MRYLYLILLLCFATAPRALAEAWTIKDMVSTDEAGVLLVQPKPVPEALRNPWPREWERGFRERADYVLREQFKINVPNNTYFENEKRSYGYAMAQLLSDQKRADALGNLQGEDAHAKDWNAHTLGIDLFPAFTLKHQTRKYFYFGDLLEPNYKQRMFDAAKIWTQQDPLNRPNPVFKNATGYTPEAKNSWVDVRTTDNLTLMRNTSAYLFAEETGNVETQKIYADRIATYVKGLYRIGMGEWDSENYHGHSIAPLHNLYDFAKDEQLKAQAKAGLDWLYAAGAVKYRRGGFNGPTKRDYNHVQPFQGGSAAASLWLTFDDSPVRPNHWESDEIHQITSAYRPPAAVVKLARKQLDAPVEVFASKPTYRATQDGLLDAPPMYLETQYLGRHFQMGSLASGTDVDGGDTNGFKILIDDSKRGILDIQAVPGPDPLKVGSPQYQTGKVAGPNRVGQYRNLAIWLVKAEEAPWTWVLPKAAGVETVDGVTFVRGERAWLAIHPLGATPPKVDEPLTQMIAYETDKKTGEVKRDKGGQSIAHWADHQVLSARGDGKGAFSGFALEVGEQPDHKSYDAFKTAVLDRNRITNWNADRGEASYTATDGRILRLLWADELPNFIVERDGQHHDWARHARHVYTQADAKPGQGVIEQPWLGGTLTVRADGSTFTCTVADDGEVTFENK